MIKSRMLLSCVAALALSSCADASLDNLIEQISTPGNVPTMSNTCKLPAGMQAHAAVQSAYLFEYEGYNIVRIANAGLSCGEALVQPEGVGEGCPIPRSTWQLDVGFPADLPYLNTPIAVSKYPSRFRSHAVGHNYCTPTVSSIFGETSTLTITSLSKDCMVAEYKNIPEATIFGNKPPYELVNLNGAFPVQVCTTKKPEIGMSFSFELEKAKGMAKLPTDK